MRSAEAGRVTIELGASAGNCKRIAPRPFGRVIGFTGGMWSASLDVNFQTEAVNILAAHTGVPISQLYAMSLKGSPPKPLLLPLRENGRHSSSTRLQFCSQCLADDAQPYFRRQWRLATKISCPHHRCGLRDHCPVCQSHIAAFSQVELVPQHFCAACGFDLRRASSIPVNRAIRSMDQCIHDICRLETITCSLLKNPLVRRLLAIPDHCGQYPRASIVSLSTSARIRCYARLSMQPHNWLIDDDDAVVAVWRRSILSANGHVPLIGLLADALERRTQGPPCTKGRLRTAELSAC
nr:TniQ family protein [Rhizobium ruizarguesonis]